MLWSSLFLISIAQGLFLISLIVWRAAQNPLASRLIIVMLVIMILTNFSYVVVRTDLRQFIPWFFGVPFGMIFLFGPLFYFYSKAVIDNAFHWKKIYWLHFIPYLIQLIINFPLLTMDKIYWVEFINSFLSGTSQVRGIEKVVFAVQDLHLFVYLFLTFRWIQSVKRNYGNVQYIISVSSRIKWLKNLFYCFSLFLMTVFSLYIFVLLRGMYHPVTNYIYTLITSGIIYFIAYKIVLNPELISPDFIRKYRAYMQFAGEDGERYLKKLKSLMNETKIFTNPDLKLSLVAEQLGLPAHQVSKLINEKFGKSYNDFVNEYRVQEFISRINHADFKSYSIYGVALDVGFNSKSSFNIAFKKITGKTPSKYKTSS